MQEGTGKLEKLAPAVTKNMLGVLTLLGYIAMHWKCSNFGCCCGAELVTALSDCCAVCICLCFRYPSGSRYEGQWHENKKSGKGVYYFKKASPVSSQSAMLFKVVQCARLGSC